MPKKLEEELKRRGKKKGFTGALLGRYIYGTLRRTGWKPEREKRR